MMMRQSSVGIYSIDEDRNVMPLLHYWKDELAAWLAKVRGPVPYPLEFKPRPRPTGEETLAVFWEYGFDNIAAAFADEGGHVVMAEAGADGQGHRLC